MRSMKNNYSKKVIDVIEYSREEAARLQNSYIGPEHLMLGLLREGNGNAVTILQEMNADLTQIKKEIEHEIRNTYETGEMPLNDITISKSTERVLRMSMLEARIFKSERTRTEHLLLALLKEEFNTAAQILGRTGIDYHAVYGRSLDRKSVV